VRFRVCSLSSSIYNCWMDNLRPDRRAVLRWKVEDRQLERPGNVMWQAGTSKVVAPAYID
jgi:hypothetical protein